MRETVNETPHHITKIAEEETKLPFVAELVMKVSGAYPGMNAPFGVIDEWERARRSNWSIMTNSESSASR
jgi:hypothetical protein